MRVKTVNEDSSFTLLAIEYFQKIWASKESMEVYRDSITHAKGNKYSLPQWYLLMNEKEIVGCAGLITNDFISRMDLFPWICALYIEPAYRGNNYGKLLIDQAISDASKAGFDAVYLATDHIRYYEKFDFTYIGEGYHPWGKSSRIYKYDIKSK